MLSSSRGKHLIDFETFLYLATDLKKNRALKVHSTKYCIFIPMRYQHPSDERTFSLPIIPFPQFKASLPPRIKKCDSKLESTKVFSALKRRKPSRASHILCQTRLSSLSYPNRY
ncbi:hypothetical protein NPIL_220691 [Nephila pilipes]|uniref:Uncharacterized protein n=1 Tax=Nephila pilipes TaxID=299642 RepID=A0A8X6NJJ2_NEPPI|nr:hypothetical protein NPIL_220691 [Nephila pilipes]